MAEKKNSLREYYRNNQPYSAMALAYLCDKGTEQILSTSIEEYTKATEAKIAASKDTGDGFVFFTKEVAIRIFEVAKELAQHSIFDIIREIHCEVSGKSALRQFIDEEVPCRLRDVLSVPRAKIDEDVIEMCAQKLEDCRDIMFDYEKTDKLIRDVLKEDCGVQWE